jgi:RNA polymerase sigma-B factor
MRYDRDRDELVQRFMPLARSLAQRYSYTSEPMEDLTQVAYVGLLKAIDGFDAARGTAFSSYAVPTILGELRRHFRDKCWAIHVPRALQDRTLALSRASERLATELGRTPSLLELTERLGWTTERVLEAREAAEAYRLSSLDEPMCVDASGEAASVAEAIGVEDGGYEVVEALATITPIWRALAERDRRMLRLRYAEGLTQREIGERVGCSQMHVSRLLKRAIGRLSVVADGDSAVRRAA